MQWSHAGKKEALGRSEREVREKLELDMNLFYCSYPYGTASTSIFTGAFAWDKQWLSHAGRRETETQRERQTERYRESEKEEEVESVMMTDNKRKEEGKGGERKHEIYTNIYEPHAVSCVVQTKSKARVNWRIQEETFWLHGCNTGSWMGERNDEPGMWAMCLWERGWRRDKNGTGRHTACYTLGFTLILGYGQKASVVIINTAR